MSAELITVYHNPRCSKSRTTVQILENRGVEFELYHYLTENPGVEELRRVMSLLAIEDPRAMMRVKEAEYAEHQLADADAEQLLNAMAEYPQLIERPIVICGARAVIARPPERVSEILDD